jgi:hypothetical protein
VRHAQDCRGQGPSRAPALRVPLGEGQITEEASFTGKYTEPAIQLLEYEGGGQGIRFCYYSLDGRFQRSPMMIDSEDSLEGLRAALKSTPKLRALIKKLGS